MGEHDPEGFNTGGMRSISDNSQENNQCAAADMHRCTGAAQAFGDSPFEGETRWDMGFMGWSTCRILMDPIVFFPRKKMCFDVFRVPTVPGSKSARNAIADFIPNKQAPRI